MIVRIMGRGQWEVPEDAVRRLNVLDEMVRQAVLARDGDQLSALLGEMGDLVVRLGQPLAGDRIVLSDFIVPNPSSSLGEISEWLQESRADDGLIPG